MYSKNEFDYIINVLGVNGFICPEGTRIALQRPEPVTEPSKPAQSSIDPRPKIAANAPRKPVSAGSELNRNLFKGSGDAQAPLAVFFTEKPQGEEATLLKKMLLAMKAKRVFMILSEQNQGVEAGPVQAQWALMRQSFRAAIGIVFGRRDFESLMGPGHDFEGSLGKMIEQGGVRWMITHSSKEMTQTQDKERQNACKRETWTHLQRVMIELG